MSVCKASQNRNGKIIFFAFHFPFFAQHTSIFRYFSSFSPFFPPFLLFWKASDFSPRLFWGGRGCRILYNPDFQFPLSSSFLTNICWSYSHWQVMCVWSILLLGEGGDNVIKSRLFIFLRPLDEGRRACRGSPRRPQRGFLSALSNLLSKQKKS